MKKPDFTFNEWQAFSDKLYKAFPKWLAFILSGYLWGLEQRYITFKTRKAVDDAIAPVAPSEPVIDAPQYYSKKSEVEGLDEIGFTYRFAKNKTKNKD
jgi:hypothetical protein